MMFEVIDERGFSNVATETTLLEISSNAENTSTELTAQTAKLTAQAVKIDEIASSTKKLADDKDLLNKYFTHTEVEGVGKTIQIDYKTLAGIDVKREIITIDTKDNVQSIIYALPPYVAS